MNASETSLASGRFHPFALKALKSEWKALEAKVRRGKATRDDHRAIVNIEYNVRMIHALERARDWADTFGDGVAWEKKGIHPLNIVRRQVNELQADGLDIRRCTTEEDRDRIREVWPDWAIGDEIDPFDIDLSPPWVSQRMPERERAVPPEAVEVSPAADTGPGTPDPPV